MAKPSSIGVLWAFGKITDYFAFGFATLLLIRSSGFIKGLMCGLIRTGRPLGFAIHYNRLRGLQILVYLLSD
jgi:hypothetical protein